MPWQSQRRKVKQHREEDLAELSGGLPCGEEATLRGEPASSARGSGQTAASPLQMERNMRMTFGAAPRKKAGSRGSRVWGPRRI